MRVYMQYSKDGRHLTEQFEGCKLQAYPDVRGIWTIGYGHTAGVEAGDSCTEAQADEWLAQDIQWAEKVVNSAVSIVLDQNEFDAVVDFVFNCGSGNFLDSTLLKKLNANDIQGTSEEFERWDKAGGVIVAGLLRRRIAEEQEFDQGEA